MSVHGIVLFHLNFTGSAFLSFVYHDVHLCPIKTRRKIYLKIGLKNVKKRSYRPRCFGEPIASAKLSRLTLGEVLWFHWLILRLGRFGFGAFFFVSSFYHTYISLSIWQYAKIFGVNFVKNHESESKCACMGKIDKKKTTFF